jgi:hypothetical protein
MSSSDYSTTSEGTGSDDNNGSSTPSPPPLTQLELAAQQRGLARIRQLAKDQFWKVINDKWPVVREECGEAWKDKTSQVAKDCQVERSIIREHVEVFEHGAVMSVVVFVALRLTGHPKFRPFTEKYVLPFFRLWPTKKNKAPVPTTNNKMEIAPVASKANPKRQPRYAQRQSSRERPKSYLEVKRDQHLERINEAADAPYDLFVSTLVGISATIFFLRPAQLRLDFEEAPLMPGRSYWCEHMCDDFVRIYQSTDPVVFQLMPGEDANLESFQKFAVHCILRSAYIQQQRASGMAKPEVLPTSGPWDKVEIR